MPRALFLIPVFELLGLFGFVRLAQVESAAEFRHIPLILAIIAMILVVIRQGKALTPSGVVRASLLTALIFVAGFQAMGLVYGGLNKDLYASFTYDLLENLKNVLSVENLVRLSLIAAYVFVGHMGLFSLLRILWYRDWRFWSDPS